MILGKNTKIPQTGITVLSHAQATPQNITAGKQRLLKKLLIELFLFTDLTQGFSMQYAINIVKFISYIIQRNICYWIILLWCISCLSIQNWARCVDCEKHPIRLSLERTKPLKVPSPSPPLKKGTTGDCPLFIPG